MQGGVDASLLCDAQDYTPRLVLLEALGGDGDVVRGGRGQHRHSILAVGVGCRGASDSALGAGDLNLRVGDNRTR